MPETNNNLNNSPNLSQEADTVIVPPPPEKAVSSSPQDIQMPSINILVGSIEPDNEEPLPNDIKLKDSYDTPPPIKYPLKKWVTGYRIAMAFLWSNVFLIVLLFLLVEDNAKGFVVWIGLFTLPPTLIAILILAIIHKLHQRNEAKISSGSRSGINDDNLMYPSRVKFITKLGFIYFLIVLTIFVLTAFAAIFKVPLLENIFGNYYIIMLVLGVLQILGIIGAFYSIILLWRYNRIRMVILLIMFLPLIWSAPILRVVADMRNNDYKDNKQEVFKQQVLTLPFRMVLPYDEKYIIDFGYGALTPSKAEAIDSANVRIIRKQDLLDNKQRYEISHVDTYLSQAKNDDAIDSKTTSCKIHTISKVELYKCSYAFTTADGTAVAQYHDNISYRFFFIKDGTYVGLEDTSYPQSTPEHFFTSPYDPEASDLINSFKIADSQSLNNAYEEFKNINKRK